jgi:uncharacterized membrane protein YeaQ/YmgE (transglycosylase-associated protein family)
MSPIGFLLLLLIAAVCGAIGQSLVGYSVGGFLVSSVIGIVGAYIGYWLARQLGLPPVLAVNVDGQPFPVIWSIIGSVILVLIVSLLRGTRWARL